MRSKGLKVAVMYGFFEDIEPRPEKAPFRRYIRSEEAFARKLAELGDVKVVQVFYNFSISGDNEDDRICLLYQERKRAKWVKSLKEFVLSLTHRPKA
jgi:hypothetical protein